MNTSIYNTTKKLFLAALAALCCWCSALAIPAYPGLIDYTQPDGSVIRIRIHGDEFCHWVTDAGGQLVELDGDGFYRPASEASLVMRRQAGMMRRAAAEATRGRIARSSGGAVTGQQHFLVILVEFNDVEFTYPKSDFEAMMNNVGFTDEWGSIGSARDYYYQNSHGLFEPVFDIYGPVKLNNDRSYYGENSGAAGTDKRPYLAVAHGCSGLDSEIDFSQYDNDGDGEVDLVFMYYAGAGEADGGPADTIWPHQWAVKDGGGVTLTLDGKKINLYACTNELMTSATSESINGRLCGIGTACHEFAHAIGLPDLYDTDYANYDSGQAGGLYRYSLMASGSYNGNGRRPPYLGIEERIMLGWVNPNAIREFGLSGSYTIPSVDNNVAYRSPTDAEGEYFLYECRTKNEWDAGLPEAGMIAYHVDKSENEITIYFRGTARSVTPKSLWDNWSQYNCINENGSHPCFYVIPAGDQGNLYYTSSDKQFAFPGAAGATTFCGTSWSGATSQVSLSNISYNSTAGTVTLNASVPSTSLSYNVIANPKNGSYSAGDVFSLSLASGASQSVTATSWYFDDEPVSGSSITLPAGTHTVEAHLTLASGATQIVELRLEVE